MEDLKSELRSLMQTRLAWFIAGVYLSGQDLPAVFNTLKTFVGL